MATENLALPLLEGGQSQKHVTVNEALRTIDAAAQLSVMSAGLSAPPVGADEGARYIVGPAATGLWGGHDGEIAIWRGGGWAFRERLSPCLKGRPGFWPFRWGGWGASSLPARWG